ncbi:hypothetical protein ILUMI_18735 [Ignelater luminosus]|uniref:Uncharacterized protein n=1 Tax=Ignelater luminosus TaxID=2038154 RepID=A0A8K0CHF3_IGNLU|nr:hypothetical protein ILUMI_18735 [Ignelater luminosus]
MLLEIKCPKRKQQQRSRYLNLLFSSEWEITKGPPSVLTADEENTFVRWITTCSKKGFPRRRLNLISSVKNYLETQDVIETAITPHTLQNGFRACLFPWNPDAIDLTKCLGKRPATRSVAESPIVSTPTLTFEQFSDFCGVDMLNQLRQQPSEQDNSSHEAVWRRVLGFFTGSCLTSVAHYSPFSPDRGTELEDQLPTLEEANSSNEFLPIIKNNDCSVQEPDEELTAVLCRCTNQAESSNDNFTTDYLKDYKAPDNIICLLSTSKAPSAENIIFQDIEIKVTEDNIQEEHISPDDILENKI